jgi:hypothetical protein
MFPEGAQFDMGKDGELKHLDAKGVSDVTPKNMFADFTVTHKDTGKVIMRGSQINTPGARAHIEKESRPHTVTWNSDAEK